MVKRWVVAYMVVSLAVINMYNVCIYGVERERERDPMKWECSSLSFLKINPLRKKYTSIAF